jgi:CRISPR-associated protein Csd1
MILQSLYQLYQRLPDIDRPGFAPMGLSWAIVLSKSGILESLMPLRQKAERGNKLYPLQVSAPTVGKRTINPKPGFLADKTDYVLGVDPAASGDKKALEKLKKRFELFRDTHLAAQGSISHPDFDSVCEFLKSWNPESPANAALLVHAANASIQEIIGSNLAFQISGNPGFVHNLEEVQEFWINASSKDKENHVSRCLVTGDLESIKLVHPAVKGIFDEPGKPAEKGIVVFQTAKRAFSSYGKDGLQGVNAPVSIRAALGYSSALNWLIKNRRLHIGDTTTIFWTAEASPAEANFLWMLSGPPALEDENTRSRISQALIQIKRGTIFHDDLWKPEVTYYILGLSPNASRISIRFWHTSTLGDLADMLKLHLSQLEIVRQHDESNSTKPDPIAPNTRELLQEIVPFKDGRKDESKLPPLLAGALTQSILTGTRYPDILAQTVMNRIRILEKKPKGEGTLDHVTYLRAAILKAWLMRNHKDWLKQQNIQMTTALDKDNKSIAYQLGRLFAVYEQAQRAAHEFKLERTIRETMFSSACSTPLAVFVRLDKLNKHHLMKLKKGSKSFLGSLIEEIHQKVNASAPLPSALDLKGQSLFCIGYYHQRHEFRPKSKTTELQTV